MFKVNKQIKHIVLVALLAAGLIASCTAAPAAPPPIATTQSAKAETAALQKPVFIEFYSTL